MTRRRQLQHSGKAGSKFTQTRSRMTRFSTNGVAMVARRGPRLHLSDLLGGVTDAFHAFDMRPHDPVHE